MQLPITRMGWALCLACTSYCHFISIHALAAHCQPRFRFHYRGSSHLARAVKDVDTSFGHESDPSASNNCCSLLKTSTGTRLRCIHIHPWQRLGPLQAYSHATQEHKALQHVEVHCKEFALHLLHPRSLQVQASTVSSKNGKFRPGNTGRLLGSHCNAKAITRPPHCDPPEAADDAVAKY
jgi:hypothetical protein